MTANLVTIAGPAGESYAPPPPGTLPPITTTGPVVVATGPRNQKRSRWIRTLSSAWSHPEALDRPVLSIAPMPNHEARDGLQALLFALGKDPHVTGASLKDDGSIDVLAAWLLARHVREVIVLDANVGTSSMQRTLVNLVVGVGARIWLIAHHNRSDELDDIADQWAAHRLDLDAFDEWWERPTGRPPRSRRREPVVARCDLPAVAAWTFRADCRRLMTPTRFAEVDGLYTKTFFAAMERFAARSCSTNGVQHEDILALIRAVVRKQADAWQVITCARAVEAAALHHGWAVEVDHRQLLNAAERFPRPGRLGSGDYAAIDAYGRPSWPAACAMVACEIGPDDAREITLADVADDGSTINDHGTIVEVPTGLRPYLVCLKLWRTFDGAGPADPALVERTGQAVGTLWMTRTIRVAEVECGIRLVKERADRHRVSTNDWARAHGIEVRSLRTGGQRKRRQR